MNDLLMPIQVLITKLQNRNAQLEWQNKELVKDMKTAETYILDELQASYDTHMYNASGDGDIPLISLEDAKCSVQCFLDMEQLANEKSNEYCPEYVEQLQTAAAQMADALQKWLRN